MKLAICNEMFENRSLDEVCQIAAEIGYDGIEIAPFTIARSVAAVGTDERQSIRQAAASHSLEIVGLHWLLVSPEGLHMTHPGREVRDRTAEYFKELVRFCSDIGGELLVIGSPKQRNLLPGVSRQDAFAYCKEVFMPALDLAAGVNIDLCFEPLARAETDFVTTASEGIELVQYVDHPNFKLHLDVKAMSDEETPIPEIIRAAGSYIRHFHINDPNMLGPGMGDIDFEPVVLALEEAGYSGYLSVEVFNYEPGAINIAKQSYDYMQQILSNTARD